MGRGAAGALGTFTLERRKNESASKQKRTVTQIYKEHQHCPRRGRKPQYEGKAYRKGLPRDINVWLTERLEDWLIQWLNGWSGTERLCDWMARFTATSSDPSFFETKLSWHNSSLRHFSSKYWSPELLVAIRQWRKDLGSRLQVWCLDIPCITRWSRTIKDRQDSSSPRKAHSITDVFHVARGAIHGGYWQKGSLRVIWAEVPMRLNQAPEAHHQIPQLTHP